MLHKIVTIRSESASYDSLAWAYPLGQAKQFAIRPSRAVFITGTLRYRTGIVV